ncbi:MAG: hypothetical protein WCJ35_07275 [Planctomycetota bacterium]
MNYSYKQKPVRSLLLDQLKANIVVRGPFFPEPVQVIVALSMGGAAKLVGKGLNTGQVHEPILNAEQLPQLTCTADKAPFDGDPQYFRPGVETMRLALLPALLGVWIDHGSREDWGPMCYPPWVRCRNRPKAMQGRGPE